jgi:APA family basic amino acid/polyamine antiporter
MGKENQGLSPRVCILMAIGGMVGSSIFTLSGVTYGMAGQGAILTWLAAAVVLLLYSLNIAELATIYPQSGGIYVYPSKVVGKTTFQRDLAGWLASWSWLNVTVFGTAFSAICLATYLQEFLAFIKDSRAMQYIIPLVWLLFVWFINALNINKFGKIHNTLTYTLMFVISIYIVLGLINGSVANIKPFISGTMGGRGVLAGIPIAMLAYGSVMSVATYAGEIRDPRRNVPKIIGTALSIVATVYALILLSTFLMAPVGDFLENPGRQYFPLAYALGSSIGGKSFAWITNIVPIAALLALTTNMSIMVLGASRIVQTTALSGYLPRKLGEVHPKTKTPVWALTAVAVVAALLTLKPDLIWLIINTGSICSAITVAIIAITLITLRYKQRKGEIKERGVFQVPFGILFPVITLVVVATTVTYLFMGDGGLTSLYLTLGWYALGMAIFLIRFYTNKKKGLVATEEVDKGE